MELVPNRPNYNATDALAELIIAIKSAEALLENEKTTRSNLRAALTYITGLFADFDVHMVSGADLPDVWELHRKKAESMSDNVLAKGIDAATKHLRDNPGDTAGAARILDACQITADLFAVKVEAG